MDLKLKGSKVLVTGATSGIGWAATQLFAAEGCDVAVNARNGEALDALATQLRDDHGAIAVPCPGDMSQDADVREVVARAIDAFGYLDVLVACAGSVPGGGVTEIADEEWHAGLDLKFLGYVRCCREVLPHMASRGSGSIVLIVGNAGVKPSPFELAAGVANAANLNFASAIADEYASQGVRINTVNPGPVETRRWPGSIAGLAEDRGISEKRAREVLVGSLPMARVCAADEVAPAVAFLASPLASYITGTHLVVDGGQRKAYLNL